MPKPTDALDPLSELQRRCRELGAPLTLQRRAVYEALAARFDHPTAEEVFEDLLVRFPGISKATAYRTLDKLVEIGLVRRVLHPGSAARYDAKMERHHHLVCDRCGAIADLRAPALDELELPDVSRSGFEVRDFSVSLRGLCRECRPGHRAAEESAAPRAARSLARAGEARRKIVKIGRKR